MWIDQRSKMKKMGDLDALNGQAQKWKIDMTMKRSIGWGIVLYRRKRTEDKGKKRLTSEDEKAE